MMAMESILDFKAILGIEMISLLISPNTLTVFAV
jgi:hypothetical protein